jgi:hypothetical protein
MKRLWYRLTKHDHPGFTWKEYLLAALVIFSLAAGPILLALIEGLPPEVHGCAR